MAAELNPQEEQARLEGELEACKKENMVLKGKLTRAMNKLEGGVDEVPEGQSVGWMVKTKNAAFTGPLAGIQFSNGEALVRRGTEQAKLLPSLEAEHGVIVEAI